MSSVLRKIWRFQSTLSVRRATPCVFAFPPSDYISIHALREESDDGVGVRLHLVLISIHALREESDAAHVDLRGVAVISIHALREESDALPKVSIIFFDISIHALREESDWRRKSACVR